MQPSEASDPLSLGPSQSTLGSGAERAWGGSTPVRVKVEIAVGGLAKNHKVPEEGEGTLGRCWDRSRSISSVVTLRT